MPASILPFKAPHLAPEKARLLNRLCVRGSAWRTPMGAGKAVWEILSERPSFPGDCEVAVFIGKHAWTARFSDASFLLRHSAFTVDAQSFEISELPTPVRAAVLSSLLAPAAEALQSVLNVPVAVGNVRFLHGDSGAASSPWTLDMKLRLTGCTNLPDQTVFVSFIPQNADGAQALAELLGTAPLSSPASGSASLAGLPLELAFESGYLELNVNDTASLASGDVLIPQVWHPAEGRLALRLCRGHAPALSAPCSFADGKAVLEGPLSPDVEPVMDSNEHNDIDIRLSFELDRTTITLGELSTLAPGYVFTLGSDAQSPVTVRANGKAIARGRLVDMDGTLGVQLSEML